MNKPTAPLSIGLAAAFVVSLLAASIVALPAGPAISREPDKTLKLFFGHTGERGEFTFKRNGRYDRGALNKINKFLRDWRKNEPARMDPQLLDLVWAVYKESGSRDYIHVISAYRSPATNNMLRSRSSGVAKNSQHTQGRAMDFYLPDVPLSKLRGIAMKLQGGGVGYYPRSGSPFVHVDTGNVRAWPRMTRQQLIALFPNGNTLHLPADGKPLPGYERAVARRQDAGTPVLAYVNTESDETESDAPGRTGTGGSVAGWLKRVFPGDGQEEDDTASGAPVAPSATGDPQLLIASTEDETTPRMPRARPQSAIETEFASLRPAMPLADDANVIALLASPAPRARPDDDVLGSLGGQNSFGAPIDAGTEDAIAALTLYTDEPTPAPAESDYARTLELAFAAAEGVPESRSAADSAIISAFAVLDGSKAVHEADETLAAAAALRAVRGQRPDAEPQTVALAFVAPSAGSPEVAQPPTEEPAEDAQSGIVLISSDYVAYEGDEDALLDLIESGTVSGQDQSQLAMPEPAAESELFVAPGKASEVADLRGESGPPVDRFAQAPAAENSGEQSFFSKLFASMIE